MSADGNAAATGRDRQYLVRVSAPFQWVRPMMQLYVPGFGGISLGSTPTAIANMSAVSQVWAFSASLHHRAPFPVWNSSLI
ncbi:hypothetical protein O9929_27290 [Vibrio lentus]|nr:hypothetical protein [Vibrio lentus]